MEIFSITNVDYSFLQTIPSMWRYFPPKIEHPIFEWILKPLSGPISGGGWFIDIYVLLMLISPLLNKLLSTLNQHDYWVGLGILSLLDIGYGFFSINTSMHTGIAFYISFCFIILAICYKSTA